MSAVSITGHRAKKSSYNDLVISTINQSMGSLDRKWRHHSGLLKRFPWSHGLASSPDELKDTVSQLPVDVGPVSKTHLLV